MWSSHLWKTMILLNLYPWNVTFARQDSTIHLPPKGFTIQEDPISWRLCLSVGLRCSLGWCEDGVQLCSWGASWKGVFTAEAKWESGRAASSLWSSTQPHKLHQPIQMPCLWHPDQKRKHIIWNKFTRLLLVAESPIFQIINNWVISQNKQW